MKGIILAGGTGSRLSPITRAISKHLLPIYNKPMIYYPLSTLMLAGIREILIISTPRDINGYKRLLGNGEEIGLSIVYEEQSEPRGIPEAFIIGENFLSGKDVALILGDNIFHGQGLVPTIKKAIPENIGATIFTYHVNDPERFGIAEVSETGKVLSLEEKPAQPKSNKAVTGLYFFSNDAVKKAKHLKPSRRGELEITDLNREYMNEGRLHSIHLGRGFAWLDTGTPDSLIEAGKFIQIVEKRQGLKVACIEEIAFNNGWISRHHLERLANKGENKEYESYLESLIG